MVRKINRDDEDEEDEIFYYRYSSAPSQPRPSSSSTAARTLTQPSSHHGGRGGGLSPSKSTVYVGNLDFTLTNSDLFTIFSTFVKVAKVTILRTRLTRQSRGVAFILLVSRDDAVKAVNEINGKILNSRTLTASIAADNGRAPEFIQRKEYKDKSRCYECGEGGHWSYECPKNQLRPRQPPQPSKSGRRESGGGDGGGYRRRGGKELEEEEDEGGGDELAFEDDNWASVVDTGADERLLMGGRDGIKARKKEKKKKEKKVILVMRVIKRIDLKLLNFFLWVCFTA